MKHPQHWLVTELAIYSPAPKVIETAKPLGIAVHDHIIVGKDGHASLKGLKFI